MLEADFHLPISLMCTAGFPQMSLTSFSLPVSGNQRSNFELKLNRHPFT